MLGLWTRAAMPWRQKREADMQFLPTAIYAAVRGLRAGKERPHELADGACVQRMLLEDPRGARELPAMRGVSAARRGQSRR